MQDSNDRSLIRSIILSALLITSAACAGGKASVGDPDDGAPAIDAALAVDIDGSPGIPPLPDAATAGSDAGQTPAAGCLPPAAPTGPVFYVATNGNDSSGDGSSGAPWATITGAVSRVPDGATILVRPGTYNGRVDLDERFAGGVVIRSEVPYQAKLRHNSGVVRVYQGQGITLEGFDIAHSGPGAGALVVQVQDLIGEPGGAERVSRIVLRNNVLHDSFNNDILKINNGASDVLVEGNLFYNQTGADEHIDINSVTDVVIQDNVFFNDFEGSGRQNPGNTSSFVVIKDSNDGSDGLTGTERVTVRRNVFLHYQGDGGTNFLLVGEDGKPYFEARDVLVENNLFIGDGSDSMRAAFGVKGAQGVRFRSNTIVGDLPSSAFAMRLNREGSNQQCDGIEFYNNVWSDPTGTMEDFSDTPPADTATFVLDRNLYWNGGAAIPDESGELIGPGDDVRAVTGDPRLGAQQGIVLPRLSASGFDGGSADICSAHRRLVELYGTPGAGSAAIDAADASKAPDHDILKNPRAGAVDLGAVEVQ